MAIHGYCMCGAIQVTIYKPATKSVYCHCDNCKRQSGASGTYVTIVDKIHFKVEQGTVKQYVDKKTDSGTPLDRWFCGDCGCPIYSTTPLLPDKAVVKMGLFTEVPKPSGEWYTVSKQHWEPTIEGITTYEKVPSS